jgi:hypothetical protein
MVAKDKKKLFVYTLTVIVFLVVIDFTAGFILEKFYTSAKSGICYQENYSMTKTNQEVLLYGSSRCAFHYVPSILEEKMNKTVYNCGREGTGLFYHYGLLLATLERYDPKLIVLDLDYRDIYKWDGMFDTGILNEHSPFYHRVSDEFDELLTIDGPKEAIKLESNLYRYNSKFFRIITGNLVTEGRDNLQGYRPLDGKWKHEITKLDESKLVVDNRKLEYVQKFIKKAQSKGVKVVIMASPCYTLVSDKLFSPLAKVAAQNKVKFVNYSNDKRLLDHREYFKDDFHLNTEGAKVYSGIVAEEIKRFETEIIPSRTILTSVGF